MKKTLSWSEKYKLALKETMSLNDIRLLRECGTPRATMIRDNAIKYCLENDIEIVSRRVPTIAVLSITNHNLDYYYNNMILESKCLNYCEA